MVTNNLLLFLFITLAPEHYLCRFTSPERCETKIQSFTQLKYELFTPIAVSGVEHSRRPYQQAGLRVFSNSQKFLY